MENDLIRKSIQKGRLQLTLGEKEVHYGIVIAFLIPIFILAFVLVKGMITGTWKIHPDFYYVVVVSTLLAGAAYFVQFRRLRFVCIESSLTTDQVLPLIRDITEKNKWHLETSTKDAIIFRTMPGFWSGSWGEQITILTDNQQLFINSICDPRRRSSVFSNGRNSTNMELLKRRLEKPAANKR